MKLFKILFVFSTIISTIAFFQKNSYADALPNGYKQVGGYIKIKGWDTVTNYILIQPMDNWNYCLNKDNGTSELKFRLLNDGELFDFSFFGGNYYGIAAINKQDVGDINFDSNDPKNPREDTFKISCNSEAFKNSLFSDKNVPHEDFQFKKEDPALRMDYVVTLKGVDLNKKNVLFDVSEPIKRFSLTSNEAVLFEKSIGTIQKVEIGIHDCENKVATIMKDLDTTKIALESCNNKNTTTTPNKPITSAIKTPSKIAHPNSEFYFASLSFSLIMGVIGFLIGKKLKNKPVTTPTDAK